jgi:hypothetical protein
MKARNLFFAPATGGSDFVGSLQWGESVDVRRSREPAIGCAALLVAALAIAGCSGGSSGKTPSSAAPLSSSSQSPSASSSAAKRPQSNSSSTSATSGTKSSSASSSSTQAPTSGATATTTKPKIVASHTPFNKPVEYPDGIDLKILKITQHTITETGPGEMTGKPQTTFTVKFTNHSHELVNLNQVVVSVIYGSAHSSAAPVYSDGVGDFSGSVKPGKSTQTDYAFSIPTKSLTDVTMSVRFDGLHAAATFTGRVTTK